MSDKLLSFIQEQSRLTGTVLIRHPITDKPTHRKVHFGKNGAHVKVNKCTYRIVNAQWVSKGLLAEFIIEK